MNRTDILNFKGAGHEDRRVIRLYRTEGEKTGQDRRTDTFGDVCTKTHIHIYSYTHFTGTLNIQIRLEMHRYHFLRTKYEYKYMVFSTCRYQVPIPIPSTITMFSPEINTHMPLIFSLTYEFVRYYQVFVIYTLWKH